MRRSASAPLGELLSAREASNRLAEESVGVPRIGPRWELFHDHRAGLQARAFPERLHLGR